MKPDVTQAMQQLIAQVRTGLPFDAPESQVCAGPCQGCSMKLLGFLESELDEWEARLAAGEQPGLAELSRLIRTSRKVARALEKSGMLPPSPPGRRPG